MKIENIITKWEHRAERLFTKADDMEEKNPHKLMDEGTYQKQCRLYKEASTISMILQDLRSIK